MVSDTATRRPKAAKTTPLQRRKRVTDDSAESTTATTAAQEVQASTDTETASRETPEKSSGTAASKAAVTRSVAVGALGRRLRSPRVLVGALLIALIAATGFFGYHYFADGSDGQVSQASRTQAIDTARTYAVELSSFDYRDLNKNRDSITAMSTPDFAKKYSEMVTALSQIVTDGKGLATATAPHAAIEKIDGHDATVILFVDQKATNVVAPNGKSQPYRMVITLKRPDGKWLVDNVETK